MPKSKRQRVVTLTQTSKKERSGAKTKHVTLIQNAVEKHAYVFLYSISNNRNVPMQALRDEFRADSTFLFSKVRVAARALGVDAQTECSDDIHLLANRMAGSVGLLFTNRKPEAVIDYFLNYEQADYARAGNVATEKVVVPEGPVTRGHDNEPFPHNMEPQLRKLGLPTRLIKGVVTCEREYTIIEQGKVMNADQAQLLKHFWHQQSHFKLHLMCYYDKKATKVVDLTDKFPEAEAAAKISSAATTNARPKAVTAAADDEEEEDEEEAEDAMDEE